MRKNSKVLSQSVLAGFSAIALSSLATAAQAAEFVKNGGFSQNTIAGVYGSSFVNGSQSVTATDWTISNSYTFLVSDGTAITSNINESGNGPDPVFGTTIAGKDNVFPLGLYTTGQSVTSPTGSGWFIATDGAYGVDAKISQTIEGLTPGIEYTLSFYQASGQQQGFDGNATAFFKVFLDSTELPAPPVMSIPSQSSVSPWSQITIPFTATGTSTVLKFVADGAPAGQPPFALLTGVSITDNTPPDPVPEPLTILGSMTAVAFGVASKARSKQKNK
jgi:hypothetical protein